MSKLDFWQFTLKHLDRIAAWLKPIYLHIVEKEGQGFCIFCRKNSFQGLEANGADLQILDIAFLAKI